MAKKTPTKSAKATAKVRQRAPRDDTVPVLYQDMLAEAESSSPSRLSDEGRPVKKRRVGGRLVNHAGKKTENHQVRAGNLESQTETGLDKGENQWPLQTIDIETEVSSDSDAAWEEIDLKNDSDTKMVHEDAQDDSVDLVLDLKARSVPKRAVRRRVISAESRTIRLAVHKVHLLCLLSHVHLRNHWCNDEQVQKTLRKLLSRDLISHLNPSEDKSQFQKDRSFMDGLKQAGDLFRSKFHLTARGMSSAQWVDDEIDGSDCNIPTDIDLPMLKSDFRELAVNRQGSRDVGGQLFCAMLRSAGLDTRLVCSLQPLPFTTSAASSISSRPKRSYIFATEEIEPSTSGDEERPSLFEEPSLPSDSAVSYGGDAVRIRSKLATRLGRAPPASIAPPPAPPEPKITTPRTIQESPFPVYWVEAFNTAIQKWVPVDPLTTRSVAQPSKLCPPANDASNHLSYVLAFEEDYGVRDVTLRYSQAFNAKTRRSRVEDTKGGKRWWERMLRCYRNPYEMDRDQVEDAELRAKEAREPMPRSVVDFKGHPLFALERHLKRGEVIHPMRKVGKVNVGKAVETVYRRKDVHIVKSADNWYRLGREIKVGEQPLKRVRTRRRPEATSGDDDPLEDNGAGTALYASFQTQQYIAPPVVNGQVPKNAFGNIDVYTLSMVPPGGIHVSHPDTSLGARILGIDYSDAVTGCEFRGRHGTAIIKGAVIAEDYHEAISAVLRGLEDGRQQEEEERQTMEALRMWKRLWTGLKIRQRIEGYEIEGERDNQSGGTENIASHDSQNDEVESYAGEKEEMAGGFLPVSSAEPAAEPALSLFPQSRPLGNQDGLLGTRNFPDRNFDMNQQSRLSSTIWNVRAVSPVDTQRGGFLVERDDENQNIATGSTTESQSTQLKGQEGQSFVQSSVKIQTEANNRTGGSPVCRDPSSPHVLLSEVPLPFDPAGLEDATMLQPMHEVERKRPDKVNAELLGHDFEALTRKGELVASQATLENGSMAEAEVNALYALDSNTDQIARAGRRNRTRSSSLESKGSLLSCDPEDVDAEPDWLD